MKVIRGFCTRSWGSVGQIERGGADNAVFDRDFAAVTPEGEYFHQVAHAIFSRQGTVKAVRLEEGVGGFRALAGLNWGAQGGDPAFSRVIAIGAVRHAPQQSDDTGQAQCGSEATHAVADPRLLGWGL